MKKSRIFLFNRMFYISGRIKLIQQWNKWNLSPLAQRYPLELDSLILYLKGICLLFRIFICMYFCPFSPIYSINKTFLSLSRKMWLGSYLAFLMWLTPCFLNLGHSYLCAKQGLVLDGPSCHISSCTCWTTKSKPSSSRWGLPLPLTQAGNNWNSVCGLFFLFHILYVLKPSFSQAKIDEGHHFLLSWCHELFYSVDDSLSHTCEPTGKQGGT